jgi:hypothetical protein
MLTFKFIFTIAFFAAAFISGAFAQQPKAITEYVMIDGQKAAVTRKSSTAINQGIQLTAVYDAENCQKPTVKGSIFQIIDNEWRLTHFGFNPTKRPQVTDFLPSGTWFLKSLPLSKDEVAVVECRTESGMVTQTEVVTFKKKDVVRKVIVPDAGVLRIEIMKLKDFLKLEDKE